MPARHYPAIVEGDAKSGYSVFFPALPGCTSIGATLQEAALHAEEALAGHVDAGEGGSGAAASPGRQSLPREIVKRTKGR